MDEIKRVLSGFANLMEQDNRGVQIGCYSVALVGLTIAIRRVRPFSRFRKPSDVPNHFIKERRELTGVVQRIDPNGALLMIKHKPLVALPGLPGGELPVKISGVNVTGLGISWLQTIVAGNEVKFIPVTKESKYVQCEVLLPQLAKNKKQKTVNIGESLVRIGFGQVVDVDRQIPDPASKQYISQLQAAEHFALKKKLGARYYIKPTKSALIIVAKSLGNLIRTTGKQVVRVPKLVTSS